MNRDQFDHIIRAAAGVTGLDEFVVIGSQAILAVFTMRRDRCGNQWNWTFIRKRLLSEVKK